MCLPRLCKTMKSTSLSQVALHFGLQNVSYQAKSFIHSTSSFPISFYKGLVILDTTIIKCIASPLETQSFLSFGALIVYNVTLEVGAWHVYPWSGVLPLCQLTCALTQIMLLASLTSHVYRGRKSPFIHHHHHLNSSLFLSCWSDILGFIIKPLEKLYMGGGCVFLRYLFWPGFNLHPSFFFTRVEMWLAMHQSSSLSFLYLHLYLVSLPWSH